MKKKMYDRRFVAELYDFGKDAWDNSEQKVEV